MRITLIFLIIFLQACSFTLPPERIAVIYMKSRYFDPPLAFKMIKEGQITKEEFLLQHEEMLRIKDYNLQKVIKFNVVESTKIDDTHIAVKVETIRPDLKKIFSNFYEEKLLKKWEQNEIKAEMKRRLFDPNSSKEQLVELINLEKTKHGWRVILPTRD